MTGAVLRRLRTAARTRQACWHVSPAPDGPARHPEKTRPAHRNRWFLWFVVALLALNWLSLLLVQPNSQPRETVPFSAFSATCGREIKSISAKADAVQGTLRKKVRYPADSKTARRRRCSRPKCRPLEQHAAECRARGRARHDHATSPTTSQSILEELLLGFGPTLLIVGIFV